MLINLTECFESQGAAHYSIPYGHDTFSDGFTDMPVVEKKDCSLDVTYVGDGKIELKGEIDITVKGSCDRCLKEVMVNIPASFSYTVVKPDGYHEIDDGEQWFMKGFELDTDALIYNELLMSLPMKVLCKESCKGLCPLCGCDLNNGECGCDTFVPDPRMAAIMDIFNANKEV